MSINMMKLVFQNTELEGVARLVLLALADNASDEGICWPAFQTIADKANTSKSYVIQVIADLETKGYIARKRRAKNSNAYLIIFDRLNAEKRPPRRREETQPTVDDFLGGLLDRPGGSAGQTGGGLLDRPGEVCSTVLKPSIEPSLEPSIEPLPTKKPERPEITARKASTKAAMERGNMKHVDIVATIQGAFHLQPNLKRKDWTQLIDWLMQMQEPSTALESFAHWWYAHDWRGKQGQPPTPAQIHELWLQAETATTSNSLEMQGYSRV